jgi:hypothetical protein
LAAFNKDGNICKYDAELFATQFSLLRCRVRNFDLLPTLSIYVKGDRYDIDKDVYFQRCFKSEDGS